MEQRLVDCLKIALKYNVSDIHFNMYQDHSVSAEMRIDGVILKLRNFEADQSFFNYLLYRANLDLSNAFKPQTGRFDVTVNGKRLALRFAVLASVSLTSGVLRILNQNTSLEIDDLTYDQASIHYLKTITTHRNGLFIFSGVTGSGKTTSLYTILNAVQGKKVFTLEDPVEVYSNHFVQLSVNEHGPLTFDQGLKQLMRHDPDIIMIGEIRDSKQAEIALRCALTGHLVVTSIHASSCVNTIHRLEDLGIQETMLQAVLKGISTQRLLATKDHGRMGVYEIMNESEVQYYFENHRTSKNFVTLQQKIQQGIQTHTLEETQLEEDFTYGS